MRRRIPVTLGLIAVTAAVFLFVQDGLSGVQLTGATLAGSVQPPPYVSPIQWITGIFLHASILHIGVNMYSLYVMGLMVEPAGSPGQYLLLYLGAGVGGNIVAAYTEPANTVSLGASGAIFGLVGAVLVMALRMPAGRRTPIIRWVLTILVLNGAIALAAPDISIAAHAGGFVAGAVLGWLLQYGRPRTV
ncbi:MAG TPA: rhomboid family intramembrane serine protease [Bacillota bacterium]|nr:rhomboid family intramembrane serine protease [Bacillota bacterium]